MTRRQRAKIQRHMAGFSERQRRRVEARAAYLDRYVYHRPPELQVHWSARWTYQTKQRQPRAL